MALSGLNVAIGILESDEPDIFGDPIAALSSWSASYYTLSGSDLTALANPGFGGAFDTFGWSTLDLVTDGDSTKWFTDPLDSIVGAELMELTTADETTIGAWDEGIITVASYRAKADQTTLSSAFENAQVDLNMGSPNLVFWRNIKSTSGGTPQFDLDFYIQVTAGFLPSPYDGTQMQLGPVKDDPAFPSVGGYDPDGNSFTVPAYTTDEDIVVSWFMQPTGLRLMINGSFVTPWNSTYRDADGTLNDPTNDAAVRALDWSPKTLAANAGGGINSIRFNAGANTKTDYMGIFRGNKLDSYIASVHSILLNQKPT